MAFSSSVSPPFFGQLVTPDDLMAFIADESPEGGSLSWEEGAQTMVYDIPFDFLYGSILTLLGYAYAEPVAVTTASLTNDPSPPPATSTEVRNFLRRGLPMCHPYLPYMVCTRIDNWKGIGPRGKKDSFFYQQTVQKGLPIPKFTSSYETLRISAVFTQPKYNILPDKDPDVQAGNELVRFVYRDLGAATQFLTISQGAVVFLEGPFVGKNFSAPGYGQPETTEDITLVWTKVPEDYICDRFGDPIRFINALQKVNSTEFLGYQPGTMRLDSFTYDRYRMPFCWADGSTRFWAEIKAHFKFFNPPYGPSETKATFTSGSTTITLLNGSFALAPGVNISGTGIPAGTEVLSVDTSAGTATLTQATTAASAGGGEVLTYDRTLFGHLTAPAGIRKYYAILVTSQPVSGFPAIPSVLRFDSTDMNALWYPLTAAERNPV